LKQLQEIGNTLEYRGTENDFNGSAIKKKDEQMGLHQTKKFDSKRKSQ
jgi:hypothetical protein